MPGREADGYVSFLGGMDSGRSPSLLSKDQYYYAVNCRIPLKGEGISTRHGYRHLNISFRNNHEEEIFRTGNPQGCGFYKDKEIFLLYVISGWVFELAKINNSNYKARIINPNDQNDDLVKKAYVITVPNGAVVNDGINAALHVTTKGVVRTSPSKKQIGAGLMGVYVQNRLWYVKTDRKNIFASTINNPIDMEEAYLANIYGARIPEDDKIITAIGRQGTIATDATGGNLAFASPTDFYSVNVIGDRATWGLSGGSGTGFVNKTLPGLGAISPYSFESLNNNIFYRNVNLGLVSLNNGISEFVKQDTITKQSAEASLFFDNDTERFLEHCYTRSFKRRLYTTIAPNCNDDGFVYWSGMIVKIPDPYYGKSQSTNNDIIESIHTGLRPWSILTTDNNGIEEFFCLSYDTDGQTRLYICDENINFDVGNKGLVEIESQILTRSFNFDDNLFPKIGLTQMYSLGEMHRDINIKIFSRTSDGGGFHKQWDILHKSKNSCASGSICCNNTFEDRKEVGVPNDPVGSNSLKEYFTRQDLFKITGAFNLRRWIRLSTVKEINKPAYDPRHELENRNINMELFPVFSYQISK